MPHYVTTHNVNGEAVFSENTPKETIAHSFPGSTSSMTLLSSTHSFPTDPSTEADVEQYKHDREHLFGEGSICPPAGTAAFLVVQGPNEASPMHRTMTVDTSYILEGVVELHLESGEKRTLRAGDSIVQRATMHRYVKTDDHGCP